MPRALVFSLPAAHRFQTGVAIADDWSDSYAFSGEEGELRSVEFGEAVFVFSADEKKIAPSIVIQMEKDKLFAAFNRGAARFEVLKRAIDAGVLVLDGGGQLPAYWRPFTRNKFLTFQALPISKGDARRLTLWRRLAPAANPCVFIFDLTARQSDYDSLNPNISFLEKTLADRANALAALPKADAVNLITPTALTADLRPVEQVDTVIHGWKLGYLYQNRLTKGQRDFVDAELDRPIRLKGAAGTGKTLAMVTKLLWEAKLRKNRNEPYRFLFLTHNGSAAELAEKYAAGLDENDLLAGSSEDHLIRIDTLLGLAIRDLSEDLGELRPISNDAHEGKQLQLIVLSDIVASYSRGAWITRRKSASATMRPAVEAGVKTPEHETFCWDLMNEIACVLDAEGIRDRAVRREAYLREPRTSKFLMPLETTTDREVVLDIYDRYRAQLKIEGLISVDQLTADYIGFLDSFRWDARRHRFGYDAVFVDEFHLFNPLERMTFRSLIRNSEGHVPAILMALDPRQSPRAVFLSVFGDEGANAALPYEGVAPPLARGQAKDLRDFEFNVVFRYTPEIAELLVFINLAFPETDLAEEWLPGLPTSALSSGERPRAAEAANRQSLYDNAISEASACIKRSGRGKIAVLTLSQKAFEQVRNAGRYGDKFYVVDSRDSLNRLQYVGGRIVLSMPEYVAGVQFDHVIVADVNEMDDLGRRTSLSRGRFGSNLYLAVSRACHSVTLLGDKTAGGLAIVVKRAAEQGLIEIN
jgi:hypothetical protein